MGERTQRKHRGKAPRSNQRENKRCGNTADTKTRTNSKHPKKTTEGIETSQSITHTYTHTHETPIINTHYICNQSIHDDMTPTAQPLRSGVRRLPLPLPGFSGARGSGTGVHRCLTAQ